MNWKTECNEMVHQGYTREEIINCMLCNHDTEWRDLTHARKMINQHIRRHTQPKKTKNVVMIKKDKKTVEQDKVTFEIDREFKKVEDITPELIMKEKGLDINSWVVKSFTTNSYQQQRKGGGVLDLCQLKLIVEPKQVQFDLLQHAKNLDNIKFKKCDVKPKIKKGNETFIIDIADLHAGLLAWEQETGQNYDLKIMEENLLNCFEDFKQRIEHRQIGKVIIANLGDLIHVDNNSNKTTKGTEQQVEGRVQKVSETISKCLVQCFNIFKNYQLEFISVNGNHDELISFYIADNIRLKAEAMCLDIKCDVKPNPMKARLIGNTLVGFTHGTGSKKTAGEWLVNDFRKEFGQCKQAEVHQGHRHSQNVEEKGFGVIVRTMPKMCYASAWEHAMGYRSYSAIKGYIYDNNKGLRDELTNYI